MGLGRGLLESMVELPMLKLHMPQLLNTLEQALQVSLHPQSLTY